MIDADFLTELAELARGREQPLTYHPAQEPDHVYLQRGANGTYTRFEAPAKPRRADAYNLETLAALARESGSELWVDPKRVVLLPGGKADRERVTLAVRPSVPLSLLREWNLSPARVNQRTLYQLLRTKLARSLVAPTDLAARIEKVEVAKADKMNSEVGKGRVSVDRSMRAEAAGMDNLPDELRFSVPLFEWPPLPDKAELDCAFELDPSTTPATFCIDVLPGEVAAADQMALDVLAGRLAKLCEGKEVAIYFGSPDAA